jgi:hypothetical protein
MTGNVINQEKREVIRNLYLSGIGEEIIAMQLDLEIPEVIQLKNARKLRMPNVRLVNMVQ